MNEFRSCEPQNRSGKAVEKVSEYLVGSGAVGATSDRSDICY